MQLLTGGHCQWLQEASRHKAGRWRAVRQPYGLVGNNQYGLRIWHCIAVHTNNNKASMSSYTDINNEAVHILSTTKQEARVCQKMKEMAHTSKYKNALVLSKCTDK